MFQALGVYLLVLACIYWSWWFFASLKTFFLQRFKIVSHCHAQKVHRSKFQFVFQVFTICHDFHMNIMGIKTKDAQSVFREKTINGTYNAHHELKDTLRIHWYNTGPTIYNWNPMFQHWYTMGRGSRSCLLFFPFFWLNNGKNNGFV